MPDVRSSGIVGVFSSKAFSLFTLGNSLSAAGVWMQRMAVGWLAWELTHSGFWLGAVAFADLFPAIVIGPFAGVLADRHDRRRILVVGKILQVLQSAGLAVFVAVGGSNVEVVFALALYGGIVVGLLQASRHAIIPSLVPREILGSAVAISLVFGNVARFVGPAIDGLIMAGPGLPTAFTVTALSHGLFAIILLVLHIENETSERPSGVVEDLVAGIRYALGHAAISRLLGIEITIGLFARPLIEMLPGFAGAVFDREAGGLAILAASVGIGSIAGGLWLAQRRGVRGLTAITLGALGSAGAVIVAFAAIERFWVGVGLMVALGASMVVSSATAQTLVQATVAGDVRGRVLGIWGLAHRGVAALGALVMGWLAEFSGFGPPVAVGGIVCMAVAVYMLRRRTALRSLVEKPDTTWTEMPSEPSGCARP